MIDPNAKPQADTAATPAEQTPPAQTERWTRDDWDWWSESGRYERTYW